MGVFRSGPRRTVIACAIALGALGMMADVPAANAGSSTSCLPASLKARLAQIRRKFGPIQILSTYRRGARMPNGHKSFHASCRAVDFNPPRGKYRQVANWLKKIHNGGVGTYSCGMHHIHIDNGPRVRFHHCQ
ncbi:MAG: YcbK family protein [Hyphomicrobiaceae bacterium]